MMLEDIIFKGDEDCPICFENMNNTEVLRTPCNHIFHKSCLELQFLSNYSSSFTCSICREELWEHLSSEQQLQFTEFTNIPSLNDSNIWGTEILDRLENFVNDRSFFQSPRPPRRNRHSNRNN